jgi:hypothetical protein
MEENLNNRPVIINEAFALPQSIMFKLAKSVESRRTWCFNAKNAKWNPTLKCLGKSVIEKGEIVVEENMGRAFGHYTYKKYCLFCGAKRMQEEMQDMAFVMAKIGELVAQSKENSINQNGGGINASKDEERE